MATNNSAQVRGNFVVRGVACGLYNISVYSICIFPLLVTQPQIYRARFDVEQN